MNCTVCGSESKVIDSRPFGLYWKRRRECIAGKHRWNTLEVDEALGLAAIKDTHCTKCDEPRYFTGGKFRSQCEAHYKLRHNEQQRGYHKARKLNIKMKAAR